LFVPSLGELSRDLWGPAPTPAGMPGEGVYPIEYKNRRTNVVRLLPNGAQERRLRRLADACARLWNEVNYERRQQYFSGNGVDFRGTWVKYYGKYKRMLGVNAQAKLWNEVNYERRQQYFSGNGVDFRGTWVKYYGKYKRMLGVNAQAVLQKSNEAWNSFFSLLRLKKQGKLPPFMNHVSPPGYWKDEATGRRRLILVIRQDRYIVDEQNHKLILKDFDLEVKFTGGLRWFGRQGRLEIHYDEARNAWYACIPVEVGVEVTKTGRRSRHIVKGERRLIQIATPKGSKAASIDLGINNLASVVVSDGTWLLYKGVRAKEDYFYMQRMISRIQSLRDTLKDKLLADAIDELNREVRRLNGKLRRRLLHLYRNFASHLLKQLHELGVSTIYLGYPFNIAQRRAISSQ